MADTIDFDDLQPKEVVVSIAHKKYLLREASGDAALKYRGALTNGARLEKGADGKLQVVSMGHVQDAESVVVAHSLYLADADGRVPVLPSGVYDPSRLVPEEVVRHWPLRVQARLFDWIKQNSDGLIDRGEPEKNEPSATPATSG